MYHLHWGLSDSPFRNRLDARQFHASPAHDEALARLHFLADQRRRLGVLLADPGCGKSLLLEVFAAELRRAGRSVARLSLLGLDPHELCWQLAAAFGLAPREPATTAQLWRKLTDHLHENRYQRIDTVVLLDDADEAAGDVLQQVARLAQSENSTDSRLTIILAADRAHVEGLGNRLLELAELRIDVAPWEYADTVDYITSALRRCGRDRPVFTAAALARLHEVTRGVPRRINQLADLCLLAGAGKDVQQIDVDTVNTVQEELGVRVSSSTPTVQP